MAKAYINGVEINKFVVDGGGVEIADGTKFGCSSWSVFPTGYYAHLQTMTNWDNMFRDCTNLTSLDLSSIDTSKITNTQAMVQGCSSLISLDLSGWNTSNVTNMSQMFYSCRKLPLLDVSSFDTSKVTAMSSMFQSCDKLTSLDLTSFNTSKVTNIGSMFDCASLISVYGKIDCSSINSQYNFNPIGYSQRPNLRYITFANLGYNKGLTSTAGTERISNWGVNTDDIPNARQSLIDTLITYSFDRASAGYSNCTLSLSSTTKALLTEDEIAQITSKGFTIA